MHHVLGNHLVQVWILLCQVSFLMEADKTVDSTQGYTSECFWGEGVPQEPQLTLMVQALHE